MLISSLLAFLFGGILCLIAQIMIDKTSLSPAKILVIYVCFGVFLGAVGVFEPLLSIFGCGASVPLIGFGGIISTGVREAISEYGPLGILKGSLTAASAGISAALIFGYLCSLIFSGKPKKL